LFLDVQLGGEDGLSLAVLMRRSRNSLVSVIAVTAHAHGDRTQRFLQAGCNACVSKPVDFNCSAGNSINGWPPCRIVLPRLTLSSSAADPVSFALSILAASTSQFGYNRLLFSQATPTRFAHVAFEEAFPWNPPQPLKRLDLWSRPEGSPHGMNLIKAGYSLLSGPHGLARR